MAFAHMGSASQPMGHCPPYSSIQDSQGIQAEATRAAHSRGSASHSTGLAASRERRVRAPRTRSVLGAPAPHLAAASRIGPHRIATAPAVPAQGGRAQQGLGHEARTLPTSGSR